MVKPVLRVLITLTATGAAATLGSAAASAMAVETTAKQVAITFTRSEAAAIDAANLGPVLAQLPATFSPRAKDALGQSIARYARQAAQDPRYRLTIIIEDPILAPEAVSVGVLASAPTDVSSW
ncbi:hypothetical protein [Nocardia farcinica]|uniref:hypothetical protein n=1 Tax=Nocardia farcinica TaxID=37329 RepID=UPI0024570238|nr:hypothetical protein [Nocardia farcinica]